MRRFNLLLVIMTAIFLLLSASRGYAALGGSSSTPGYSCKHILVASTVAAPSGIYWIDPDGAGGDTPIQVYCDMTTSGGGWTLAINSIAGTEPLSNDIMANNGTVSLTSSHTRNVAALAVYQNAEIRHYINDSANGKVLHAKYTSKYHDPLPVWSSWTTFADHISGSDSLLQLSFGNTWQTFGTCVTTYGAPWYFSAYPSCYSSIPYSTSGAVLGPEKAGPVAISRYAIWIRETATYFSAPGAPTIGTATAGNAQATVTFTPPDSNGGSTITSYTVTSTPDSITASGPASPVTISGLANGTAYTFTVKATNAAGTGPSSTASNSVTPVAPSFAVTPSASSNGSISPNTLQTVTSGSTTTFTVTADAGYTASVSGTCGGTLVGTTYTTNAITADCTVVASFTDNAAPTTTASPAGGSYQTAQSVTLTCSDGLGSGCANIYYTTDGTEPTTASAVYSGPITVYPTTTIKFFGKDVSGNSEAVKSAVYALDGNRPAKGRFAYVANSGDNTISAYAVNPDTGELTAIATPVATVIAPRSVIVDPSGRFAYVTSGELYTDSNAVHVYTINQISGALTAVTTVETGAYYLSSITTDPSGRFAFITATNSIDSTVSAYSINQTSGTLTIGTTTVTGSAGSLPSSVATAPSGKFAYVTNATDNTVSTYSIDQISGALTLVETAVGTDGYPVSISVDPGGRFVYVANRDSSTVSAYSINQISGALTSLGIVTTGEFPMSVSVEPTGRFAYVSSYSSNTVSQYSINQASGALTAIGTAVATGNSPTVVTVDPTARFVYVVNSSSDTTSVYRIDQSSGALTFASTTATGVTPWSATITTGVALPVAPLNIVASAGNKEITLTWNLVPGATSYNLYYSNTSGSGTSGIKLSGVTSGSTITGLTNETAYYVVVTAINSSGESELSTEVSATPLQIVGAARFAYVANSGSNTISAYLVNQLSGALNTIGSPVPTELYPVSSAIDPTGRFVYVANRSSNTVSAYTINQDTGALTSIAPAVAAESSPSSVAVDPSGRFAYVANSSSNTISMYRIDQSNGSLSLVSTQAMETGPRSLALTAGVSATLAPLKLSATPGINSAILRWAYVAGATSYNIYYSTSPGVTTASTKVTNATNGGVVSSLTGGTTYYFVVTAVNATGESALSTEVSVVPVATRTVTFSTSGNGSLSGTTSQVVTYGSNASAVTAVPASDSYFVNWTGTGGFVTTTANPLTVSSVTADMAITANFAYSPVPGVCGSSSGASFTAVPAVNLCSVGTPSSVTGSGSPWSWTCSGSHGGADASCSAVQDITGPVLVISTLSDGSYTNNATLNISGTVTDATAVASLTVNGAAVTVNGDGSYSTALPLAAGANSITLVATDSLGNSTTNTRTITLDQTAPELTVTTPADNSVTGQDSITVSGTVSETSTVQWRIGTGEWQNAALNGTSFSFTATPLVSGLNTIEITATDQAGNTVTTTAKRSVTYDTTNPELAITSPSQDITTTSSTLTLTGTVSDSQSSATISISVNGQTLYTPVVTDGAFSQELTFTEAGSYAVVVTATDGAGHTVSVPRNILYQTSHTVTPSAGAGGSISPDTPQTVNHTATTTFTVTPDSGYSATVGGTCGGTLEGSTYTTSAITADCTVEASFNAIILPTQTLTTTLTGTGTGTVTSNPAGISCTTGTCSKDFIQGSTVTLLASPSATSTFDGWTGDCSGSSCSLTMDAAKSVTATFTQSPVVKNGSLYYSLASAYSAAGTTATLYLLDAELPDNGLTMNANKAITLMGGYMQDLTTRSSNLPTTIKGPLVVGSGSVTVDRIVIK